MLRHGHTAELGESRFEIVQFQRIWPVILIGGAQDFENFEDLIDLGVSHEERPTLDHLGEDAAGRPEIDAQTVGFLAQKDLGAAVPQCDNLVSVRLDRQTERSGQAEVRQLNVLPLGVDKQILWLEISVENSVLVKVDQRLQYLVQK